MTKTYSSHDYEEHPRGWLVPKADYDALAAELAQYKAWAEPQIITHGADQVRIRDLEEALLSLLPGLVLDRRYADADDDIDAMDSRIATVQEALNPTTAETGAYEESQASRTEVELGSPESEHEKHEGNS